MIQTTATERVTETGLDPEHWDEMRRLAHHALDEVLDYQMSVRDKPVWRPVPQETEALLSQSAPKEGLGAEVVVSQMLEHVMPYPPGHGHPRFWGWVCGTGTPIGMIADMIAAGVNATSGNFNDAASRVENQLIQWMIDLFGFPEGASGIVTSGASVANMIGLAVGRDAAMKHDVLGRGLTHADKTPLVYASSEVHSSVSKSMMTLGLGLENLRKAPVDDQYRMRVDVLEEMIAQDRARGFQPVAVIATAGTVNTGALDDLEAISAVAKREDLWFHVDGAIGALALMSDDLRPRLKGLELADSLALDFHKWLYVPYEAGCVLIRDGEAHRKSFTVAASYLEPPERGVAAVPETTNVRGPQLSRGFKALKVWAQISQYGLKGLGRIQRQNVDQIQFLAELIDKSPRLERLADIQLNILCYRYVPENSDAVDVNGLNKELLMRLQEQGIATPSSTVLKGDFVLRVANTNHRSRREDFELLVAQSERLGRQIEREWVAGLN